METALIAFVPVAFIITLSPGPDSLLILYNTVVHGRQKGLSTLLGVQIGVLCHATLSALGLAFFLEHFPQFFALLGVVGGIYLGYLGVMMIKSGGALLGVDNTARSTNSLKQCFMQGMLCNLLNPKVLVLFLTIIPTFMVQTANPDATQIIMMTAILLLFNVPIQFSIVLFANALQKKLQSKKWGQRLQWGLGGTLLLFAVGLIVEQIKLT